MTHNTTTTAKKIAKIRYSGKCLFCGQSPVDGAHIYPAGSHPHLKREDANIIPLCRQHHYILDDDSGLIRAPENRIKLILVFTVNEYRAAVQSQISELYNIILKKEIL